MYDLIFTLVDVIMFVLGGMALGFVIGAKVMDMTWKNRKEVDRLSALLQIARSIDDGGAAFHEECGDR